MKKTMILLACAAFLQSGFAQELPKWASKARKAVFSVITYSKDNKILNTGNGFYIDGSGTAVSDYSLLKGADHAVIVTTDGKELPIEYILGANDMYDVVKFKAEYDKKSGYLAPASQPMQKGQTVLYPKSHQRTKWNGGKSRQYRQQLVLLHAQHGNHRQDSELSGDERKRRSSGTDTEELGRQPQTRICHRHQVCTKPFYQSAISQ